MPAHAIQAAFAGPFLSLAIFLNSQSEKLFREQRMTKRHNVPKQVPDSAAATVQVHVEGGIGRRPSACENF
jgi:hypothetical protein